MADILAEMRTNCPNTVERGGSGFSQFANFRRGGVERECKKIYFSDYKPDHFLAPFIHDQYDGGDYHRLYYGEILQIKGISKYQSAAER